MLESLEIRNFRTFDHLRIERLGRVNLIVGKNGVGKTALLEALLLYAYRGTPSLIQSIFRVHDEITREPILTPSEEVPVRYSFEHLFHGRQPITDAFIPDRYERLSETIRPIQIGPIDAENETLSLTLAWYVQWQENGALHQKILSATEAAGSFDARPTLHIQFGGKSVSMMPLVLDPRDTLRYWLRPDAMGIRETPCVHVSGRGFSTLEAGRLLDAVTLTELEEHVLAALRIIDPDVERLSLVAHPGSPGDRVFLVKTRSADRPLPLRSLGEGMDRLLTIVLALVNAKDGMLLVDEFENGLHYSVQPEIWRLIFQVAHRLNVQVFATTHSWDCIEAFQKAAKDNEEVEGELIRLERRQEEHRAVSFDESDLNIVAREQIEVR